MPNAKAYLAPSNVRLGKKKKKKKKNSENERTEAATPTLLAFVRKGVSRGEGTGEKSPFLKQRPVWWLEKKK